MSFNKYALSIAFFFLATPSFAEPSGTDTEQMQETTPTQPCNPQESPFSFSNPIDSIKCVLNKLNEKGHTLFKKRETRRKVKEKEEALAQLALDEEMRKAHEENRRQYQERLQAQHATNLAAFEKEQEEWLRAAEKDLNKIKKALKSRNPEFALANLKILKEEEEEREQEIEYWHRRGDKKADRARREFEIKQRIIELQKEQGLIKDGDAPVELRDAKGNVYRTWKEPSEGIRSRVTDKLILTPVYEHMEPMPPPTFHPLDTKTRAEHSLYYENVQGTVKTYKFQNRRVTDLKDESKRVNPRKPAKMSPTAAKTLQAETQGATQHR